MPRVITLLTDFGSSDTYVGVMKGVILGIAPAARIVDLTHDVPPHDVRSGAFQLLVAHRYFPAGTIHVAIVDPGVGTQRAIVAVQAGPTSFVGPDNGVLRWAVDDAGGPSTAVRVEVARYRLPELSTTFHGRDVMAPAAAHLAAGVALESLGPPVRELQGDPFPQPDGSRGVVIHVDRFGNCVTNFRAGDAGTLEVLGRRLARVRAYADATGNEPVVIGASAGFLEIAVNGGSAAARLGIGVNTPVRLVEA
ncbi:MAG TPA: SAM-dependent chlorinase/fluorinase [Chloroflexota bacterium]|nr:SAM-dependent chlorinase/fluorinase [Chloroflexota bacterium]